MKPKTTKQTHPDGCEKYQLDLTDYVTGDMTFLTKEKQEQLFEHLKQCAKCREEFFDWEETFGVLVTEHHLARLEIKKKMNDMIEQFKSSAPPRPARSEKVPIDIKAEIGSAAGKIYDCLKSIGEATIEELRKETGLVSFPFYEAIGWLAREEKVTLAKDDITAYVSLHPGA